MLWKDDGRATCHFYYKNIRKMRRRKEHLSCWIWFTRGFDWFVVNDPKSLSFWYYYTDFCVFKCAYMYIKIIKTIYRQYVKLNRKKTSNLWWNHQFSDNWWLITPKTSRITSLRCTSYRKCLLVELRISILALQHVLLHAQVLVLYADEMRDRRQQTSCHIVIANALSAPWCNETHTQRDSHDNMRTLHALVEIHI